jgi:hypothetical protein
MNVQIAKSRRGVSLTELLLLMSSYTIILSMCAVVLHRVMRFEIDSRSFVDVERTSARLSHQFRQDVNQAAAAETVANKLQGNTFLKLHYSGNKTVEYLWSKGKVSRIVSRDGKIGARDEFAFETTCKLTARQDKSPDRVAISITSPTLDSTSDRAEQLQTYKSVPIGLYIEASIGVAVDNVNLAARQERVR